MELYQAIVKMEQDGSADGVLQVCLTNVVPCRSSDNFLKSICN
jgi:hypothetical protein